MACTHDCMCTSSLDKLNHRARAIVSTFVLDLPEHVLDALPCYRNGFSDFQQAYDRDGYCGRFKLSIDTIGAGKVYYACEIGTARPRRYNNGDVFELSPLSAAQLFGLDDAALTVLLLKSYDALVAIGQKVVAQDTVEALRGSASHDSKSVVDAVTAKMQAAQAALSHVVSTRLYGGSPQVKQIVPSHDLYTAPSGPVPATSNTRTADVYDVVEKALKLGVMSASEAVDWIAKYVK